MTDERRDDQPDRTDRPDADDPEGTGRREQPVDPDAPGNYVDDREADEVPEPNEPA